MTLLAINNKDRHVSSSVYVFSTLAMGVDQYHSVLVAKLGKAVVLGVTDIQTQLSVGYGGLRISANNQSL